VTLDERWTAKMSGQTFFVVEVDTGVHILRARGDVEALLDVYVQSGQNMFVQVEVSHSINNVRGTLQLKDGEEGRTGVMGCRRITAFE
jgi:hypothetical protein